MITTIAALEREMDFVSSSWSHKPGHSRSAFTGSSQSGAWKVKVPVPMVLFRWLMRLVSWLSGTDIQADMGRDSGMVEWWIPAPAEIKVMKHASWQRYRERRSHRPEGGMDPL